MADTTTTENNSGGLSGMSPWMRFVAIVGVPSAGLAYLIWLLGSQLTQVNSRLEAHERATVEQQQHFVQETDQQWALYGVLQRICINTAKSDEDKKSCTTITTRPR